MFKAEKKSVRHGRKKLCRVPSTEYLNILCVRIKLKLFIIRIILDYLMI